MSSTLSGAQPLGTHEGMKIMRDNSSIWMRTPDRENGLNLSHVSTNSNTLLAVLGWFEHLGRWKSNHFLIRYSEGPPTSSKWIWTYHWPLAMMFWLMCRIKVKLVWRNHLQLGGPISVFDLFHLGISGFWQSRTASAKWHNFRRAASSHGGVRSARRPRALKWVGCIWEIYGSTMFNDYRHDEK